MYISGVPLRIQGISKPYFMRRYPALEVICCFVLVHLKTKGRLKIIILIQVLRGVEVFASDIQSEPSERVFC